MLSEILNTLLTARWDTALEQAESLHHSATRQEPGEGTGGEGESLARPDLGPSLCPALLHQLYFLEESGDGFPDLLVDCKPREGVRWEVVLKGTNVAL